MLLSVLKDLVPKLKEIYFFLLHDNEIYVFLDFTFIKSVIIKVTAIIVLTHLHETEVKTILTVIMKVSKMNLKIA